LIFFCNTGSDVVAVVNTLVWTKEVAVKVKKSKVRLYYRAL